MNLLRKVDQLLGNFTTHDGVIVLTYHHVSNELAKDSLVVSLKNFKLQMSFLDFYRNKFEVIGLDETLGWFKNTDTHRLKKDAHRFRRTKIAITFDDGFKDNYTNVFPILRK